MGSTPFVDLYKVGEQMVYFHGRSQQLEAALIVKTLRSEDVNQVNAY